MNDQSLHRKCDAIIVRLAREPESAEKNTRHLLQETRRRA
jgi:hypothetical protein